MLISGEGIVIEKSGRVVPVAIVIAGETIIVGLFERY
jgi:hypothetical protein